MVSYRIENDGIGESDPTNGFGEFVRDSETLTGSIYIYDSYESSFDDKHRNRVLMKFTFITLATPAKPCLYPVVGMV